MPRAIPPPALPFTWPSAGWEYMDINIAYEGAWAEELDKLGREGWMLVSVIHDESVKDDTEATAVFMKPRAPSTKAIAEGRVKKRKSATSETGHEESVDEDEESDEDAP